MYIRVTVQAAAGDHAVLARSGRTLESLKSRVNRAGMLCGIMAALAEARRSRGQELKMIASMGCVARQAIL